MRNNGEQSQKSNEKFDRIIKIIQTLIAFSALIFTIMAFFYTIKPAFDRDKARMERDKAISERNNALAEREIALKDKNKANLEKIIADEEKTRLGSEILKLNNQITSLSSERNNILLSKKAVEERLNGFIKEKGDSAFLAIKYKLQLMTAEVVNDCIYHQSSLYEKEKFSVRKSAMETLAKYEKSASSAYDREAVIFFRDYVEKKIPENTDDWKTIFKLPFEYETEHIYKK